MTGLVWRTDDVPAEDRFDYWRACLARAVAPMAMDTGRVRGFRAEATLFRFGCAHVWPIATRPVRFLRTAQLIRQSDPEFYHLSLPLRGRLKIAQDGREAEVGAGEMYVIDTSLPYELRAFQGDNTGVGLDVPKSRLPLPSEVTRPVLARPLPAQHGIGALLAGCLTRMTDDAASYRPSDGPRLETVLTDLLAATLAHHLEADARLQPETRSRTLTAQVQNFIHQHLHDPGLSPAVIAAAHHVSVGHLHRLFNADGTTVTSWIRQQRLERIRRDLADPALRGQPMHRIAARWGLPDAAVFSRVFRAAYGLPPRDYRHQALREATGPPHGDA